MSLLPFLDVGMRIIDKIIPDPEQKAKYQFDLLKLQQEGQFKELEATTQLAIGQIETNKAEAASNDPYSSRWRPTIGYICAIGLAYNYLIYPLLVWIAAYYKPDFRPPPLVDDGLMELVLGMLGLAGLRTFEKVRK